MFHSADVLYLLMSKHVTASRVHGTDSICVSILLIKRWLSFKNISVEETRNDLGVDDVLGNVYRVRRRQLRDSCWLESFGL